MHPAAKPSDEDLVRARTSVGDFDVTICSDGSYMLDGGAMFGVVPKTLWSKRMPADEQNRILMGLNTVVVRTGKQTVVIETGIGNKESPKMREVLGNKELLPQSLHAAGVRPEDVDIVINTHLHFDHCGWNTTLHADGSVTPTFPNARYIAHGGEVEHSRLRLERDGVAYVEPNYEPLISSGQMTLIDLDLGCTTEVCPGISLELFPGHTDQMMVVHIESGGQKACYAGDLIPTASHLDITWAMAYDIAPLRVVEERKRFYARAVPENWLVLFTHDHQIPMGRVVINEKGKPVLAKT